MRKEAKMYASWLIDEDVVIEIQEFAQKQGDSKGTISLLYLFIKLINK